MDTHANSVSYGWWCEGISDCYPSSVTYNGTVVTLYREARPDPITFAAGGTLGRTNYRLMTIDVSVGGRRARAYSLVYASSAHTARSLLVDVRQLGTDAVLDASGVVSSGSALPAMSMVSSSAPNALNSPVLALSNAGPSGQTYNAGYQFTADFNGDGRDDYMYYNAGWYVALSNGSGFGTPTPWLGGQGPSGQTYNPGYMFVADFNGDGKADYMYAYRQWYVALSTGTGFATPTQWLDAVGPSGQTYNAGYMFVADFNGDGKADYMYVYRQWYVALSTGTGFATPTQWLDAVGPSGQTYNPGYMFVADFNGDGKADYLYCYRQWYVALSTGSGFATPTQWLDAVGPSGRTYNAGYMFVADFNGDNRADFIYCYYGWYVALSTSTGFATPTLWLSMSGPSGNTFNLGYQYVGDFNGDGKADLLYNYYGWYAALSSPPADLLSTLNNGLGGSSSISYVSSSSYPNTYLPLGMVLPTVGAVTTTDGRGVSSTVAYSYDHGLWSDSERRFLGFRHVTSVIDAAGDFVEVYYHQGVGCISKPDVEYLRDPSGNIYHYTSYGYTENTAAPYTSLLTEKWTYECELTSSCRRVAGQYAYDQYGNVTTEYRFGDYDVIGDETILVRGYRPNLSSYIVGLPAYENVYEGLPTASSLGQGALLSQVLTLYDGSSAYTDAPVRGDVTGTRTWNSENGGTIGTSSTFDQYGNVTSKVDTLGNTWKTTYDSSYHLYTTAACNPLNQCQQQSWDYTLGLVTSSKDANGANNTTAYDVFGRVTTQTNTDGTKITKKYANWGQPLSQYTQTTAATGSWSREYVDGTQRPYRTLRSDGVERRSYYTDLSARPSRITLPFSDAAGETARYISYSYDAQGRQRSVKAPDGTTSRLKYGVGPGFAYVQRTDQLGHDFVEWRDASGNVVKTREQLEGGNTLLYTNRVYDRLGHLLKVTDALGHSTTHTYNSLGWELTKCDMDLGCTSFRHDNAGRVTAYKDANGLTVTDSFDVLGRRRTHALPDGTVATWKYDEAGHGAAVGRLTSVTDASGSESYTYDAAGRVITSQKCVQGVCYSMSTAYSSSTGQVTSRTYFDGEVVGYGYDAVGRLISVGAYVINMQYNSADQPTTLTYGNGTTTTYAYSALRGWLETARVNAGGATLYQSAYSYNDDGLVTALSSTTDAASNFTYSYDDLHRLIGVSGGQTQSFSYDATGNLMSNSNVGSYVYADPRHVHAQTRVGAAQFSYDAVGNLLSSSGSMARTFTWTADSQPASITTPAGKTTFLYDAAGARVYKSGPSGKSLYFGPTLAVENGQVIKYYFAGASLVAKRDPSGTYWFHQDHLGSVRLLTNASAAVVQQQGYAAFGETLTGATRSGTAANEPRGFGGHLLDAESGLIYMNARYYDASIGRFISADPIVPNDSPQALNRYAFASNNPISNVDPTGHAPGAIVSVVAAVSAGVAAESAALGAIGAAMSVAGIATHDRFLLSVGAVILGFTSGQNVFGTIGGGLLGGSSAALTSPISPLSPGLKQAIGWAWSGVSLASDAWEFTKLKDLEKNTRYTPQPALGTIDELHDLCPNVAGARVDNGVLTVDLHGIFSSGWRGFPGNLADTVQGTVAEMPEVKVLGEYMNKHHLTELHVRYAESMGSAIAMNAAEYLPKVTIDTLHSVPLTSLARVAVEGMFNNVPKALSEAHVIAMGTTDLVSGNIGGLGLGFLLAPASHLNITPISTGMGFLVAPHTGASIVNACGYNTCSMGSAFFQ